MHARSETTPSAAEIAGEANTLVAGLGIFTLTFLPLAVPGLVLVVAPLVLVALVGAVLAIPFVLPIWLARVVWRRRSPSAKGPLVNATRDPSHQRSVAGRHATSAGAAMR